jgi:hypothetical protein
LAIAVWPLGQDPTGTLFDLIELQRSGDGFEYVFGNAADAAPLELGVVLDADASEQGHFFSSQA